MIKIYFEVDNDGICSGFRASGHAGYAARGDDIVCAAVSALTWGAAHALDVLCEYSVEVTQSNGDLMCKLSKPDMVSQTILTALKLSLEEVEKQYSNYVRVCLG